MTVANRAHVDRTHPHREVDAQLDRRERDIALTALAITYAALYALRSVFGSASS
jgi:hypothetical protein